MVSFEPLFLPVFSQLFGVLKHGLVEAVVLGRRGHVVLDPLGEGMLVLLFFIDENATWSGVC